VKLLLDTHIWAWSLLEPERLRPRVAAALASDDNELWLSPVSSWELLLLIERGRLQLDAEPLVWIEQVLRTVPMQEAPLTNEVALTSRRLKLKHQDPADRFLAATAVVYDLTLVTADRHLLRSKEFATLANR
jgi:PIN domain nuclease of toxin-antitoxin system